MDWTRAYDGEKNRTFLLGGHIEFLAPIFCHWPESTCVQSGHAGLLAICFKEGLGWVWGMVIPVYKLNYQFFRSYMPTHILSWVPNSSSVCVCVCVHFPTW